MIRSGDRRGGAHRRAGRRAGAHRGGWATRTKIISGVLGAMITGGTAFAATNWVVGLNAGSSGEGQSASISNLTIAAVAVPAAGNLLYPGGTGDVVATITNPNTFPVTVTGVQLPTNTTYASAYSDSALSTPVAGCAAGTPSGVTWAFANGTSGTTHTFTSAVTVAASGNLTVTLTNDATMTSTAPAACANSYFSLPAFTGVVASGGAAAASASPATTAWTS